MYQKMISYIYEYRNGQRGKNIGFAKLALQNQNYKIKIQLRLLQGGRSELEIYGFIREDEIIHTAYFGSVKVENGLGDVMFSGNSAKVWKEKNFMKMNGFLLLPKGQLGYGTISNFCATQWDDAPIVIERLDLLQDKESRKDHIEEEIPERQEIVLHAAEIMEPVNCEEKELVCVGEAFLSGDNKTSFDKNRWSEKGTSNRGERNNRNASTESILAESVACEEEASIVGKAKEALEETQKDAESERMRIQRQSGENSDNTQQRASQAGETEDSEDSWEMFEQRRNSMRKKWENIQQECQKERQEWKQGEEILKKFPVMNPFFDKEVVASVRMEPKDLGNFPMEHWYLANNSFLLHGYYYYRHLLFLKMRNQQEYMYAIAVPGNNDYRENFMANMFGFEQFKVVQNQNNAGFGYWWRRMV